jgi:ribosomal protein S18 acetylase RimI-like enzyme
MPKTQIPTPVRAAEHGLSYRMTTDADLPVLTKIYASTRTDEVAQTGWPPQQQRAFLQMQFEAQHKHYRDHYPDAAWLLITQGVTPVGRLYLEDWPNQLRIIDVALLSEFRGKGWGQAILRDLMDATAPTNRAVSIHVEKNNPAMSLYLRLGFEAIEDKGVYDLMEWRA